MGVIQERVTNPNPTQAPPRKTAGWAPLLGRDQESRLGKILKDSSAALEEIAAALPRGQSEHLYDEELPRPGSAESWAVREARRFCDRLDRLLPASSERILKLVQQAKSHSVRMELARKELAEANMRLVVHIARDYAGSNLPWMDMIQEGNIGLMRAVDLFNYELGHKFSTYGYWWIKQAIERAIAEKGRMIRIPVNQHLRLNRIARATQPLRRDLGRMPTREEIAREINEPLKKVREAMNIVPEPRSLDEVTHSFDDRKLLDKVEDPQVSAPDEQVFQSEFAARIQESLAELLTPLEARILRLRFGFGDFGVHTLEASGKKVNLSRERVRQIEAIALSKLRQSDVLADLMGTLGAS